MSGGDRGGGPPGAAGRPVPGVRTLDHTADVGIEVHAPSLADLFRRAAWGMAALIFDDAPGRDAARDSPRSPRSPRSPGGRGSPDPDGDADAGEPPSAVAEHVIELDADDAADLLALWLRELLYRQQVDDFNPTDVVFEDVGEHRLRARVRGGPSPSAVVRELKGVTYHGLEAERTDDGWRGRVIFDV